MCLLSSVRSENWPEVCSCVLIRHKCERYLWENDKTRDLLGGHFSTCVITNTLSSNKKVCSYKVKKLEYSPCNLWPDQCFPPTGFSLAACVNKSLTNLKSNTLKEAEQKQSRHTRNPPLTCETSCLIWKWDLPVFCSCWCCLCTEALQPCRLRWGEFPLRFYSGWLFYILNVIFLD